MNILFNWFPPAMTGAPSPAYSILTAYLSQFGISCDTIYWNIRLSKISRRFTNARSVSGNYDVLLPFLAHIAEENGDRNTLSKLAALYQVHYPQYKNIKSDYYLETLLNASKEIEIEIKTEIQNRFSKKKYDLIGVCAKLFQHIPASVYSKIIKSIDPNTPVAIGGIGTEKEAIGFMTNFEQFDLAMWGEGENSLKVLCDTLENNIPLDNVPNLVYRDENNNIKSTYANQIFMDLNSCLPDYSDFFKEQAVIRSGEEVRSTILVEGGRGCNWKKCKFCYLNSGYKNRCKSPEVICQEIRSNILKYNVYHYSFLDNDIIDNLERFDILLDGLILIKEEYEEFKIKNAEIITKDMTSSYLKKMALAGFGGLQIGHEAISDSLLRKICKKNTVSSNLLAVKWALEYGIKILSPIIITSLIGENDEDVIESINNLHYFRFYLNPPVFKQKMTNLAVMSTSKYYKSLSDSGLLENYNSNAFFNLMPAGFIKPDLKYIICDFVEPGRNALWDNFNKIESFYLENSFSYTLIKKDGRLIYRELQNLNAIKVLEFEEDSDELHWKILELCNHRVVSLEEMISLFGFGGQKDKIQNLMNIIEVLNKEYLLYSNPEFSENFTIINTDKVL